MGFFIDTNVIIFAAFEPSKVPQAARTMLAREGGLASAASLYENSWKHRLGKLALSAENTQQLLFESNVEVQSVSADIMIAATQVDWDNRDPWDRIIAAQALSLDVPLISADSAFDDVPGLERVWT